MSIYTELRTNFDREESAEIMLQMRMGMDDFEEAGYRFIAVNAIDKIMQDELSNNKYMLGCFNAWFLADILDMDLEVIEALQKAEAYEAIGKMVLRGGKIEQLQQEYVCSDSYGHHFGSYDGYEHEVEGYYYFQVC